MDGVLDSDSARKGLKVLQGLHPRRVRRDEDAAEEYPGECHYHYAAVDGVGAHENPNAEESWE